MGDHPLEHIEYRGNGFPLCGVLPGESDMVAQKMLWQKNCYGKVRRYLNANK